MEQMNVLYFTGGMVISFIVSVIVIAHLFEKAVQSRNDDRK